MKFEEERRKVKAILKETISLVCKNGLTFRSKFNVEGLIGITLDDEDVILMSLNDLVRKPAPSGGESEDSGEESISSPVELPRAAKRGRGRPRGSTNKRKIKTEPVDIEDDCDGDNNWNTIIQVETTATSQDCSLGEWDGVYEENELEHVEEDDGPDDSWTPTGPRQPQRKRRKSDQNMSGQQPTNKTPVRNKPPSRLPTDKKLEIVKYYEANPALKQCQIKSHFENLWDISIPQSTFNDIIRKHTDRNVLREREVSLRTGVLEGRLQKWYSLSGGYSISADMVFEKAKEICEVLNIDKSYIYSEAWLKSWLEGFKKRHDIK